MAQARRKKAETPPRKTALIVLRVTDDQHKSWANAARAAGDESFSVWARRVLARAAREALGT